MVGTAQVRLCPPYDSALNIFSQGGQSQRARECAPDDGVPTNSADDLEDGGTARRAPLPTLRFSAEYFL
jgi:hypothetical protein